MQTVRTLTNQINREAGGKDWSDLSDELSDFWDKLNIRGFAKFRDVHPDNYPPDVDAASELERAEAEELLSEFRQLLSLATGTR